MKVNLSIIISAHNGGSNVARAIKSLHLDKHPDWEAVFIDNATDDKISKTVAFLSKKYNNLSHRVLSGNIAIGSIRNFGISLCSGIYIAFLDANDTVEHVALSESTERAISSDADVLLNGHSRVYEQLEEYQSIPSGELHNKTAVASYLAYRFASWEVYSHLFKRSHLIQKSCMFTAVYYDGDIPFFSRALSTSSKIFADNTGYYRYYYPKQGAEIVNLEPLYLLNSAQLYYDKNEFLETVQADAELFHVFANTDKISDRNHLPSMALSLMVGEHNLSLVQIHKFLAYILNTPSADVLKSEIRNIISLLMQFISSDTNLIKNIMRNSDGIFFKRIIDSIEEFYISSIEDSLRIHNEKNPIFLFDILKGSKEPIVFSTLEKHSINQHNKYLPILFNITEMNCCDGSHDQDSDIISIWGGLKTGKPLVPLWLNAGNKPTFLVEDGFLKSIVTLGYDVDSKFISGVCFSVDDLAFYFDATRPSRLETLLNSSEINPSVQELVEARDCIDLLVKNKLTKYNHQPLNVPELGTPGKKKVLVIDQAYNDFSIIKGMASDQSFKDMLACAVAENPNADILVKTHPDLKAGWRKATSYYSGLRRSGRIFPVTASANPYALLEQVDKVYVATSQLGFEALLAGKEVHCFGMPFYAGWGATKDRVLCERRTRTRSLEEIFYITYLRYLYYVDPVNKCHTDFRRAVSYLLELRDEFFERYENFSLFI